MSPLVLCSLPPLLCSLPPLLSSLPPILSSLSSLLSSLIADLGPPRTEHSSVRRSESPTPRRIVLKPDADDADVASGSGTRMQISMLICRAIDKVRHAYPTHHMCGWPTRGRLADSRGIRTGHSRLGISEACVGCVGAAYFTCRSGRQTRCRATRGSRGVHGEQSSRRGGGPDVRMPFRLGDGPNTPAMCRVTL